LQTWAFCLFASVEIDDGFPQSIGHLLLRREAQQSAATSRALACSSRVAVAMTAPSEVIWIFVVPNQRYSLFAGQALTPVNAGTSTTAAMAAMMGPKLKKSCQAICAPGHRQGQALDIIEIEEGLRCADRDSGQDDGIGQSDRRVKLESKLHDAFRALGRWMGTTGPVPTWRSSICQRSQSRVFRSK